MESVKIFIVEDDPVFAEVLFRSLSSNPHFEIEKYENGTDLINNLHRNPAIISLDFRLPDLPGFHVLKKIKEFDPDLPVIVVSGQEDVTTAITSLKEGAYDYIVKDNETPQRLRKVIANLVDNLSLKKEITELKEKISKRYDYETVIKGKSPVIQQVFQKIEKATKTAISIVLSGESGTGKDLVAKAIHYSSPRKNQPFVAIDLSAVSDELTEYELFGYEKGAFPGAFTRKTGKLELANRGTLYLDEISELSISMQSRLLHALQEKEITRAGGSEVIKTDFRLIVAASKGLAEEVQKGRFRQDLYYKLLGLPIELPPLRYRGNDILLLARFFIDEFCRENSLGRKNLSANAQDKLMRYSYPGNVRELRSVIELACVMSNGEIIDDADITFNASLQSTDFLMEEDTLEGYNRKIIRFFLQKYNNNVMLVASKLDIGKSTIYRMLKNNEL